MKISKMTCLKLRMKSNLIGHVLDILTDVFCQSRTKDKVCSGFLSRKGTGKNEVTRNLTSSFVEKFNVYEMIRQDLACKEGVDIAPSNIVYDPILDENISVPCFFHRPNLLGLQKLC